MALLIKPTLSNLLVDVDKDWNAKRIAELGAPTGPNDAARLTDVTTGGGGTFGAAEAVTIATGAIAVTGHHYKVDTESGAASDDLDTINAGAGVSEGWAAVLRAADNAHTVVCKDGAGNLKLASDFSLDNVEDSIMLIYDGTNWLEISRSDNGA